MKLGGPKFIICPGPQNTSWQACCSVCRTCRRALLRLEKLKADYDALKGDLKAKVRRGSRQVRLHSRSPTGTTPAAKRAAAARCRSVQTAAKELFPTGQSISLQSERAETMIHRQRQQGRSLATSAVHSTTPYFTPRD